ncbi:hypothetical protein PRIPAC_76902 [Pristionchus pacificus]|uniref:Uncharacterized protein n=1 Tax=Pristionchus pacificus TaxID=54126 RepID=A0A2A6CK17_PRIPA|nr:hypothetical protein PRIPAC_76902 [Pristionchus pacificus]|eukprot:PDM78427.1 hypothetical protein PRIPAC_31006 [Pristionchus pacificus]
MTMGIVIFHIDVPLAPDGVTLSTLTSSLSLCSLYSPCSLASLGKERRRGKEIDKSSEVNKWKDGVILTEGIWKNCFRRHAIWSQRDVDMKNDYAHRHSHPQEPQTT